MGGWRIRRVVTWTVWLSVLLVIAGMSAYHLLVLEPIGHTYLATLHPAADDLRKRCTNLVSTTQVLLLEEPPRDQASVGTTIANLRRASDETRRELHDFATVTEAIGPRPHVPISSSTYYRAITLKNHARGTIDQINEVLDEYDQLASFLASYYAAHERITSELMAFNAQTDLNVLVGRSPQLHATAADILQQSEMLANLPTPRGLEDTVAKSIAIHKRAAHGFDALGSGLSPPVDNLIYGAAKELEATTEENDASFDSLEHSLEALPVFTHIVELPEKIERFKF